MKTTKEIIQKATELSSELEKMGYEEKSGTILDLVERTAALFIKLQDIRSILNNKWETTLPKEDTLF